MDHEMSLEWDSHPDTRDRLARALSAGLTSPTPGGDEDMPAEPDGASARWIGAVTARRDGALSDWVDVYQDPGDSKSARAQWMDLPRSRRRRENGFYDRIPPTAQDAEVCGALYKCAAEHLRAVGYRVLRWTGADNGPEGQAARRLNARSQGGGFARMWSVDPATWQAPSGLPEVTTRAFPESARSEPSPLGNLRLATDHASGATAEIFVVITGPHAYVNAREAIRHQGTGPGQLAALIADLLIRLRQHHRQVTELAVFEFDDDVVCQALKRGGMRITSTFMEYELPLL